MMAVCGVDGATSWLGPSSGMKRRMWEVGVMEGCRGGANLVQLRRGISRAKWGAISHEFGGTPVRAAPVPGDDVAVRSMGTDE